MRFHVNCACAIGTSLNLDLLCVVQNGVGLELHRTAASQFAHKRAEGGYYDGYGGVPCMN